MNQSNSKTMPSQSVEDVSIVIDIREQVETDARPNARRTSRRWRSSLLAAALIVMAVGAAIVAAALPVRHSLLTGRDAMVRAASALADEDRDGAATAFQQADHAFQDARARLEEGVLLAVSHIPLAGRSVRTSAALAQAGALSVAAGEVLTADTRGNLGDIGAYVPRGGGIPVERLADAQEPLGEVLSLVSQARAVVEASPSSMLLRPVADARSEALSQLVEGHGSVVAAEALSRGLPSFLGVHGTRRYLFGAATPAEVRGTGGLIGAYSILTAEDGRMSFGRFLPSSRLQKYDPDELDAPNEDYAARYDRYGGAGFMLNINMTPDFPSAAVAMEELYQAQTGQPVDGVVVADPEALAALLRLTGPVDVPNTGTVDADNVVELLANDAYGDFEDQAERKSVLGDVAGGVFQHFLDMGDDLEPRKVVEELAAAVRGRHLQFHSTDSAVQDALDDAGMSGRLAETDKDFLAFVPNNAAGNKIDFYADWMLRHEVWLEPDGSARTRFRAKGTNHAPRDGQPKYVIGPSQDYLEAGDNQTIVSVFCAKACEARHHEQDEATWPGVRQERELGYPVFTSWQWAPSGGSTSVDYTFRTAAAWSPTDAGGSYDLTMQAPPMVRPPNVELVVHAPPGMTVAGSGQSFRVDGATATWSGALDPPVETFELKLRKSPSQRIRDELRAYAARTTRFWTDVIHRR